MPIESIHVHRVAEGSCPPPALIDSHFFPEVLAGGFTRNDGNVAFYQRINALVSSSSVLIDFGAGRGASDYVSYRRRLSNFKGRVSRVVGLDVDPAVMANPSLDEAFLLGPDGRAPLPAGTADIIFSDFVFEHFRDPIQSAAEIDRLLKPGGWICARTPNRFGYIAVANRLIPDQMSNLVLKILQPWRKPEQVFPAFYRLNTPGTLRKFFPPSRFEHFVYTWDDAEPLYHANSRILYRAFLALKYLTPPPLKPFLMIFIRKKSGTG
jgi:SAM-dependent methyltransferase